MNAISMRYLDYALSNSDTAMVIEAADYRIRSLIGLDQLREAEILVNQYIRTYSHEAEIQGELARLLALRAYLHSRRGVPDEEYESQFDEALARDESAELRIRLLRARALALRGQTEAAQSELQHATELGFEDNWDTVPDLEDFMID